MLPRWYYWQRTQLLTLSDINHSKILYDPSPRVMEIKTKINKQNLIKLKSFCTAKETTNKTKRQPTEWEKIFANEATDRGLVSKIYKQLMWLNTQKNKKPNQKNRQTLSDVNHSKTFYDPSPRVMEIKAKINKWDLIKLKI